MKNPIQNISKLNINIFRSSAKAIACMTFGFDALRTNSKNLSLEMENLIKKWVCLFINILVSILSQRK